MIIYFMVKIRKLIRTQYNFICSKYCNKLLFVLIILKTIYIMMINYIVYFI